MTDEVAAALFDAYGSVEMFVVDRATFLSLRITGIELPIAKRLKEKYRGTVYRKKRQAYWSIGSRDSELFAEAILPHIKEKRDVLELFLKIRAEVINSAGRGKASTLDNEDITLREEIAAEFKRLQEK